MYPRTVTSKLLAPTPFLIRPRNNRLRNVNICPVLLFVQGRAWSSALRTLCTRHGEHSEPAICHPALGVSQDSWYLCSIQVLHREPPVLTALEFSQSFPMVAKKD